MVPASSDLNDWLLLVATGLNWLHSAVLGACDPSVYHGHPSKVQEKALGPIAGEIRKLFHQCGGTVEEWTGRKNCKLAPLATTGQESTARNVWTWKRICAALPAAGVGGLVNTCSQRLIMNIKVSNCTKMSPVATCRSSLPVVNSGVWFQRTARLLFGPGKILCSRFQCLGAGGWPLQLR